MGENTVASCVVFKQGKADKKSYRIFNINNIIAGDDYAAMKQVILRRYKKIKLDNKPDLILIDGGVGQLKQAQEILQDLKLDIKAIGVAKGKGRKAGLETLININNDELQKIKLPFNDLALLLINHIRDESHRFAITKHRKKQIKTKNHSFLENIEGIGNVKRKSLLHHFGGMQEIKNADITQLIKVKGINNKLAEKIIKSINS
ncbi:Excinuclease ABC subunit C [hydrothermal vent metagenome]|uniref:Excinuclease ABC subunit C n=1 Tax=hydrothermal vent metagenome TaxID=652676 RepID=A0A1W1BSY4_9ZZZZ